MQIKGMDMEDQRFQTAARLEEKKTEVGGRVQEKANRG